MDMEQAIGNFAIYGGMNNNASLDLFDSVDLSTYIHFVQEFTKTQEFINPSYLMETPYKEILIAIARGDGRFSNVCKRARVGEELGSRLIDELSSLGVVSIEPSRQAPLRANPKHMLPKHLKKYRIEHKVRFVKPFYRFWFGFVEPYREMLLHGDGSLFSENFEAHKERAYSLLFERLSVLLLKNYFRAKDPIISQGSFWDQYSEFDLLSISKSGKIILGECKYTSRPVTKKELTKLKEKAVQSGIKVDRYALFAKSGFSNELLGLKDEVLLFSLDDFRALLRK